MYHDLKAALLATAILAALGLQPARGEIPLPPPSDDAWGIVSIPAPREARLMQLAGIAGKGTAIVRLRGADTCRRFEVRLVAGGFWGMDEPVRGDRVTLLLSGSSLVRSFSQGEEIVSGDHRVSGDPRDLRAEIRILEGLPPQTGFVVQPGGSFLAGIFGPWRDRVSCDAAVAAVTRVSDGPTAWFR